MAQFLPASEWTETTVVDVNNPPPPPASVSPHDEEARHQPAPTGPVIRASELASPLSYDEVEAINRRAESATVIVRALIRNDPRVYPPEVTREGVATLVQPAEGEPVLLTTLSVIEGAASVDILWDGQPVRVNVRSDARYGLALLEPESPLAAAARPLPVLPLAANEPVEVFSSPRGSAGATLGAADQHYNYYQQSTLGVTLGYPLINRRGELVGIGSHRYPLDPAFSLSISSASVEAFLAAQEAEATP